MRWPKGMEPDNSAVYARNEITIAAPPERVWKWLVRAKQWPMWYDNCAWFRFESGASEELAPARRFTWKTFGATVRSTVQVFEPFKELGWDAASFGLRAYHGWLIEPDGSGSKVVTEEVQNGLLPVLARWYLRPMLLRGHQNWVESLKRIAEVGDPN